MAESSQSADMRLPKRLPDFNPPACSQKRIRVTLDRGLPPYDALANLQPRPQVDIISRPSSDTEAILGEYQDVCMIDDSFQALPFADPSPMDIGVEIVEGGEANIQEICYGAVRHLINHKQSHPLKLTGEQLCDVHASLRCSTVGKSLAQDGRHFQQFHIILHEDSFSLLSGKNEVVAVLDVDTCRALQCLHDHQGVRATAVVETSRLMQTPGKRSSKGIFPLSINIYGT